MTPNLESDTLDQVQVFAGLLPAEAVRFLEARAQSHLEDIEAIAASRMIDNIVMRWELADARDRWRHTGEQRPAEPKIKLPPPKPYRTPQSTIKAFWYVAGLDDPDYLKRWLAQHPLDVTFLQKLWEAKHAGA